MSRRLRSSRAIPPTLAAEWRREPEWLAALPRLAAECADRWDLTLEEPFDTPRSLVIPAGDVVLKLNAPSHREAEREADALAAWAGRGAVRLVDRDDDRRALLVERCTPGTPLSDSHDEHAVVAALLPRLQIEPRAPHSFALLADEARRWVDEIPRRYELAGRSFEPALVAVAVDVVGSVDRGARWLVNQDLHGGNILRAAREPWLVIDPKPLVGEVEANAVGLLRNAAWRDGTAAVRRWLDVLEELDFERTRTRDWGIAHALAWGWHEERGWSAKSLAAARTIAAA
jgi:streptomycin 6-kinase